MEEQGVRYITPTALQLDSFKLGASIVKHGFRPDLMIALWRGGAPIGLYIHEVLRYSGIPTDHVAIRTSRYTAPGQANSEIIVHNLGYILECIQRHKEKTCNILIVDDVWESGGSIRAVLDKLHTHLKDEQQQFRLDIRFATLFYKPECNKTLLVPNYYVHTSDKWIIFPHELEGFSIEHIRKYMGEEVADIIK